MNNIIFECNGNQIIVQKNQEQPVIIEGTNIGIIDESNFFNRFVADIIKDANTKTAILGIAQILERILGRAVDNRYKNTLNDIDNVVDPSTKNNETILKNILKSIYLP